MELVLLIADGVPRALPLFASLNKRYYSYFRSNPVYQPAWKAHYLSSRKSENLKLKKWLPKPVKQMTAAEKNFDAVCRVKNVFRQLKRMGGLFKDGHGEQICESVNHHRQKWLNNKYTSYKKSRWRHQRAAVDWNEGKYATKELFELYGFAWSSEGQKRLKKAADRDTYMTNYRLNKRKEVYKSKSEHKARRAAQQDLDMRSRKRKVNALSPKKSKVKQKKFKLNTDQQGQILGSRKSGKTKLNSDDSPRPRKQRKVAEEANRCKAT